MKKILGIILLLLIIAAGVYFLAPKYMPDSKIAEIVDSLPAITDESEPIDDGEAVSETDETTVPMDIAINTDLSSDIAMVATADEGDGFVAFTKMVDDAEVLDKIVLVTADGETGLIEMSDEGLPSTFTFGDYTLTYSNFTESTVDIEVTRPDGTTETIEGSELNMPGTEKTVSFIPSAYAVGNWGPGPRAEWDATTKLGDSRKKAVETGDTATFTDYIFSSVGTSLNILSCGISLSATVLTAGAGSPLAYLSCGMLATRLATLNTEIGPCKGDVLDCAANAILSSLKNKGPVIAGMVTDKASGNPVNRAMLIVRDKTGKAKGKAYSNAKGFFRLPLLDVGGYSIVASAKDFESQAFVLATTDTNIQIVDDEGGKPVNQEYDLHSRKYFKRIPDYYGPELNQHHNIRFDIEFGEGNFDGDWTGRANTVVASVPDPDFPGAVIDCGGADFTWTVDGTEISGGATTDEGGYSLTLTGTIKEDGTIKTGAAFGTQNIASFDGKLTKEDGRGTWSDPYGCNGGFTVTKDLEEGAVPASEAMPVF